jgi:hypothetical protein
VLCIYRVSVQTDDLTVDHLPFRPPDAVNADLLMAPCLAQELRSKWVIEQPTIWGAVARSGKQPQMPLAIREEQQHTPETPSQPPT